MFLLFYFFAFLCVRNVVLKEKFWVENFILFKLCYFYVIIYSIAFFYLSIFRRKPRPIRENYQYLLIILQYLPDYKHFISSPTQKSLPDAPVICTVIISCLFASLPYMRTGTYCGVRPFAYSSLSLR